MFRSAAAHLTRRLIDIVDDMLVGDYDYILDGDDLYADVDYFRLHPHHERLMTWTPAAGRGVAPQRGALAGPKERRPGTVPARPGTCAAPSRSASVYPPSMSRPSTAAGRSRAAHS